MKCIARHIDGLEEFIIYNISYDNIMNEFERELETMPYDINDFSFTFEEI